MKILVPRPDDPESRTAYDAAKRLLELREPSVDLVIADDDCCVGDRSRCRCAARQLAMTDEDVDREKWAAVWRDEVEP